MHGPRRAAKRMDDDLLACVGVILVWRQGELWSRQNVHSAEREHEDRTRRKPDDALERQRRSTRLFGITRVQCYLDTNTNTFFSDEYSNVICTVLKRTCRAS